MAEYDKSPRGAAKAKAASRQKKYKAKKKLVSAYNKYRAARSKQYEAKPTAQKLLPFWVQDSGPNVARLMRAAGIGSQKKKGRGAGGG